ncbi:hypothetical protein [Serratia sp. M24T3]|uniref:hypothetical protein n=1 Tax=Serratia sp. M24T3 TaxID=932213 RepID=UPI00025B910F|nr:hypothetical protein [Serratia sp. M24T3]EIC84551.1 hypothetical protein SPM24T3_11575 [Serratia sp. M24T3]
MKNFQMIVIYKINLLKSISVLARFTFEALSVMLISSQRATMPNSVTSPTVAFIPVASMGHTTPLPPAGNPLITHLQDVDNSEIYPVSSTEKVQAVAMPTLQQLKAAVGEALLTCRVPFLYTPDLNQLSSQQALDVFMFPAMYNSINKNKLLKQETLDAMRAFPRGEGETRTSYATRLCNTIPGFSRTQAAAAAGLGIGSINNALGLRSESAGTTELRKHPSYVGESPVDYGRRLKRDFPDFPGADYAIVSGAARTTLWNYPEFQKETIAVAEARQNPESARKTGELNLEWGERLQRDFNLDVTECSRLTGINVGVFRNALLTKRRREKAEQQKAKPVQPRDIGAVERGTGNPVNLPADSAQPIDFSAIDYAAGTPVSSPARSLHADSIDENISLTGSSSTRDIDQLSVATSGLSLNEAGPSRRKNRRREKLKHGQTAMLPELLGQLRQVEKEDTLYVLDWISEQQLVGRASMGIMSAEAESAGTLLMQEVVTVLLMTLNSHPHLISNVYEAFLPDDNEGRAEIINMLPIIMNRLAGYKMAQLIARLSESPSIKQDILETLRQEHVADRPLPMAYIESNNFFGRVNIASKKIVDLFKYHVDEQPANDALNLLLESSERLFRMSEEKLKAAGLTDKPSWRNMFSLRGKKRAKTHVAVDTPHNQAVMTEGKPEITEDLLRQALSIDQEKLQKYQDNTLRNRERFSQMRAEISRKSSQSLQQFTAVATSMAAVNAVAQSAYLAASSSAEKQAQWEADKERQSLASRMERDNFNEQLRMLAPDPVRLGMNIAMEGMYQEMRGDVRPSVRDISELTREGNARRSEYNERVEENNDRVNDRIAENTTFAEQQVDIISARNNEMETHTKQVWGDRESDMNREYRQLSETLRPVQEFAEAEAYVSDNDVELQHVLAEFDFIRYKEIPSEPTAAPSLNLQDQQIALMNTIETPSFSLQEEQIALMNTIDTPSFSLQDEQIVFMNTIDTPQEQPSSSQEPARAHRQRVKIAMMDPIYYRKNQP